MQQLTCPVSRDTCTHTINVFSPLLPSSTNNPTHRHVLAEQMEAFPNRGREGTWMCPQSTAGGLWGCPLLWVPTPVPGQPQHGVHLSTMKTLRTAPSKPEVTFSMGTVQTATRVRGQGAQRPEPQACRIIKCFYFNHMTLQFVSDLTEVLVFLRSTFPCNSSMN